MKKPKNYNKYESQESNLKYEDTNNVILTPDWPTLLDF